MIRCDECYYGRIAPGETFYVDGTMDRCAACEAKAETPGQPYVVVDEHTVIDPSLAVV